MKKKFYIIMSMVIATATGGLTFYNYTVEADTCEELEAYLENMTEQERSKYFVTSHSKECTNLHKYVKCYKINHNLRCLDGKIYGPGEGGTKPCKKQGVPDNCVPCAWWE